MQQMLALSSKMSSQDTYTLAPSIQWAPSQLGKVHYAVEEGSIVISEPAGLQCLPGLCAIRLTLRVCDHGSDVLKRRLAQRVPLHMCSIVSSGLQMGKYVCSGWCQEMCLFAKASDVGAETGRDLKFKSDWKRRAWECNTICTVYGGGERWNHTAGLKLSDPGIPSPLLWGRRLLNFYFLNYFKDI